MFWLVWLGTFLHAAFLRERAWGQQCWAIAVAGVAAVGVNATTTSDNLLTAFQSGHWAVAIMDIVLLAGAGLAACAAIRLTAGADPLGAPVALPAE